MPIHFEITTPERTVYRDDIDQVSIPTSTGEITILPHHIPLVSQLAPGDLMIKKGEEIFHMAVAGGFVEVHKGDSVVILADMAERAEEIDIAKAEEAQERARKIMATEFNDSEKFAQASALLEKSMVRLRIANRFRYRGHHGVGSEGVLHE